MLFTVPESLIGNWFGYWCWDWFKLGDWTGLDISTGIGFDIGAGIGLICYSPLPCQRVSLHRQAVSATQRKERERKGECCGRWGEGMDWSQIRQHQNWATFPLSHLRCRHRSSGCIGPSFTNLEASQHLHCFKMKEFNVINH